MLRRVGRAYGIQQAEKRQLVGTIEAGYAGFRRANRRLVDLIEQRPSSRRIPAEILTTILRAALPPDEGLRLESVQQPRDPRRLLDHPAGNFERRDAVFTCPAKDPEYVELLQRDPEWLDRFGDAAADDIGGEQNRHGGFVAAGPERLPLFPRQGLYAHDPEILRRYPAADITIARIGDLLDVDLSPHTLLARRIEPRGAS